MCLRPLLKPPDLQILSTGQSTTKTGFTVHDFDIDRPVECDVLNGRLLTIPELEFPGLLYIAQCIRFFVVLLGSKRFRCYNDQ